MHSTGSGRRTSGPCGTAAHEALADTEPFLGLHSFEFSKVRVSMVERSASGGWWEPFQRVVSEAPTRPHGGGWRGNGDREVVTAILFAATTGCTRAWPSPTFGPFTPTAYRRSIEWSRARV